MPISRAQADKVQDLLTALGSDVERLTTYAAMPLDQFDANDERQFAAKRVLQLAVERAKDISDTLVGVPNGDRGRVRRLVDNNVMPRSNGGSFAALIDLRNDLVHRYRDISVTQVYKALQKAPERIGKFIEFVSEYVEREGVA